MQNIAFEEYQRCVRIALRSTLGMLAAVVFGAAVTLLSPNPYLIIAGWAIALSALMIATVSVRDAVRRRRQMFGQW